MIQNKINRKYYIGKHTVDTFDKNDNYYGSSKILKKAIAKYGLENFTPRIELEAFENEEDAYWYEHRYIKFYRENGIKLYNLNDGGKGGGSNPSLETRKKLSEVHKGKKLSEEHRRKMSERMKKDNPMYNKEISERCGEKRKGIKRTEEQKENNLRNKKVVCIETGIIYRSVVRASELTLITRSAIANSLCGLSKSAGGYHWKYYE
ncbi:MAG: hypothetical protein LBV53_02425 [Mycoplasmataceae bacterium]|jgi:group I intron endonuclease|nr:hypothetical protein [Mycoplasmataceae bacterium]